MSVWNEPLEERHSLALVYTNFGISSDLFLPMAVHSEKFGNIEAIQVYERLMRIQNVARRGKFMDSVSQCRSFRSQHQNSCFGPDQRWVLQGKKMPHHWKEWSLPLLQDVNRIRRVLQSCFDMFFIWAKAEAKTP